MRRFPLPNAPLGCWYGCVENRIFIAFHSKEMIVSLEESEAIEIRVDHLSSDQGMVVYLIVRDSQYEEQFIRICEDLIRVTESSTDENSAVVRLCSRYNDWKNFWKYRKEGLSKEQVQGLVGELLYVEKLLKRGLDPIQIFTAWHGVNGSDQDFVFEDRWAEVKTIRQSGTEVKISSLEQLENPRDISTNVVEGRLVVIRVHSDPVGETSFNLISLVDRLKEQLSSNPLALRYFLNNLDRVGVNLKDGKYERELFFCCLEMLEFLATGKGFPKIVRSNNVIPLEVTKLSYSLSLGGLKPWLISD